MLRLRELQVSYRPAPIEQRQAADAAGLDRSKRINTPRLAAAIFLPLHLEPVEVFQALYLDTKHKPLALYTVSRGTLDTTVAHPRDVLRGAILTNAAALITAHNHPSGDAAPSADDRALFPRLTQAADTIGITVLDHMIIGFDAAGLPCYWSALEAGQHTPNEAP